ncbi:MAG: esterase [Fibrobacteres bacterium]|nr:esterase [Fibrobacterota bacterium]
MKGIQLEKPWQRDPVTGVILGAEPFAMGEGSHAVLFLHGWSSSPRELRFLGDRVAQAGFRCRGPLLKGHGTRLSDLEPTRFPDFLAAAESEFDALAAAHDRVSVCGLSMGGLLGLQLAARRPVANLVLIAPFLTPSGATCGLPNRWLVGRVPLPAIMAKRLPGPIADPAGTESHIAYHAMATRSMVSVVEAARGFSAYIPKVVCPTLILHSIHDTTSDFAGSEMLIRRLGSEDKTLVVFNRGNHVITLDYEKERLEETALEWLIKRRSVSTIPSGVGSRESGEKRKPGEP